MKTKPYTAAQFRALHRASLFKHNDGWMSADNQTTDVSIADCTARALVRMALMEMHPSGFAYRITDAGRDYVSRHWSEIKRSERPVDRIYEWDRIREEAAKWRAEAEEERAWNIL